MIEEKIHDALNLLDDDLISEVEWLRSRKKKHNWAWFPMTAAVACFGIFIINQFDIAYEKAGNDCAIESVIQESLNGAENAPDSDNRPELLETPSIIIEITAWENGGFYGSVVQHVDSDIYPIGTPVYVKVVDSSILNDRLDYEAEMKLSEGMIVRVQFSASEAGEQITLYAEDFEFVVNE